MVRHFAHAEHQLQAYCVTGAVDADAFMLHSKTEFIWPRDYSHNRKTGFDSSRIHSDKPVNEL